LRKHLTALGSRSKREGQNPYLLSTTFIVLNAIDIDALAGEFPGERHVVGGELALE
jgi:hypothetical protein